jgi:hypothetical protein
MWISFVCLRLEKGPERCSIPYFRRRGGIMVLQLTTSSGRENEDNLIPCFSRA